ncbi:MAG: tautomerase family protein [Dehalococcoidia bacterium]|nr:tautomerase family protein [Dehalococcoidia bacterium]
MPHVIVKMHPGRTDEQKNELAQAIADSIVQIARCEDKSVSVAIEEIAPEDWAETVYKPDIMEKEETLVKKPGYNPFDSK